MRLCWNRQTGTFEGRVSADVWVQVPSTAPKQNNPNRIFLVEDGFGLFVLPEILGLLQQGRFSCGETAKSVKSVFEEDEAGGSEKLQSDWLAVRKTSSGVTTVRKCGFS